MNAPSSRPHRNLRPDPPTTARHGAASDTKSTRRPGGNIPPAGRISKLLPEIISGLPPLTKGYFRVGSNRPVMSFGVFGTSTLSVLSAVPPQTAP